MDPNDKKMQIWAKYDNLSPNDFTRSTTIFLVKISAHAIYGGRPWLF